MLEFHSIQLGFDLERRACSAILAQPPVELAASAPTIEDRVAGLAVLLFSATIYQPATSRPPRNSSAVDGSAL
jgi:hypothetical protein